MTKKQMKKLAQESYVILDEKLAEALIQKLRRKDLKEYIRQIKLIDKQQEVTVALANINSYNKSEKLFENIFKNKNIIYQEDPSLILGTKIVDNDLVYDMSLKTKFEEVITQIGQNYE